MNEVIRTIPGQFIFLRKDFERIRAQIKPKTTNKNTNKRIRATKAEIFHASKLLRGVKLVILGFDVFRTLKVLL